MRTIVEYCDDLLLMSPCHKQMRDLLEICDKYAARWKQEFNSWISVSFTFGESRYGRVDLNIDDELIPTTWGFQSARFKMFKFTNTLMRRCAASSAQWLTQWSELWKRSLNGSQCCLHIQAVLSINYSLWHGVSLATRLKTSGVRNQTTVINQVINWH